jgi:uncharacterized membrane protein YfcA
MPSALSLEVLIFVAGTFAAAFVTGLAGFAFGMIAAAFWMHALTPVEVTALIVAYAILIQGRACWKLRNKLNLPRLAPFVIGSVIGVPIGIFLLQWADSAVMRVAVGCLLVAFSLYNLVRPALREIKDAGVALDTSIGTLNGILGGATGLSGIVVMIWSGLRGWQKDEQRAVFQPAAVASFIVILIGFAGTRSFTAHMGWLFLLGLPALALGSWLGFKLYGKLDEAAFRKVVLYLLLASGIALVVTAR